MAGMIAQLIARLSLDSSNFDSRAAASSQSVRGLMAGMYGLQRSVVSLTAGYLGARGIVSALGSFITAAKEAEGVNRIFQVSLGENAAAAGKWADEWSRSAGTCEIETKKFLGSFSLLMEEMGAGPADALKMSESLTRLTADIASFSRGTLKPEEVFQKLQMAMQGSTKGLKSIGVAIDETKIKQYALDQGWITAGEEMSALQKTYATFNVIMGHTEKMHGDLARAAGTTADAERVLREEWEDTKRMLGESLLPAYREGLGELSKGLREHQQDLKDVAEGTKIFVETVLSLYAKLPPIGRKIGEIPFEVGQSLEYYRGTGYPELPQLLERDRQREALNRIKSQIPGWDEILGNDGANALPSHPQQWWGPGLAPYYGPPPGAQNQEPLGPVYERMANPGGETESKTAAKDAEALLRDRAAAYRNIAKDMNRTDQQVYEVHRDLLIAELAEYEAFIKDKHLLDQWYREQSRKLDIEQGQASEHFFAGFRSGVMQMEDDLQTLGELGSDSAKLMRDSWVEGSWDVITSMRSAGEVARSVLLDFAKLGYQWSMNQLFTRGLGILTSAFGGGTIPAGDLNPGMANFAHGGGTVGVTSFPSRVLPASLFEAAPRLHKGLQSDEAAFVLQRGETVRTAAQEAALSRGQTAVKPATDILLRQLIRVVRDGQRIYIIDDRGEVKQELQRMAGTRNVLMR